MRALLVVMVVGLVGCEKKRSSGGGSYSPDSVATSIPSKVAERKTSEPAISADDLPKTNKVTYKGRNADSWARTLYDQNPFMCDQSVFSLGQIGDEGLRYLHEGLQSKFQHTRWRCVSNLPVNHDSKFAPVFVPILRDVLKDPDENVRCEAAIRIMNGQFAELLPELKEAEKKEDVAKTKSAMRNAIGELESKKKKP